MRQLRSALAAAEERVTALEAQLAEQAGQAASRDAGGWVMRRLGPGELYRCQHSGSLVCEDQAIFMPFAGNDFAMWITCMRWTLLIASSPCFVT
jgi:hypothetical protein